MVLVEEHLPSKCEALSSNFSTPKIMIIIITTTILGVLNLF
jgi:hypothetical protein